MEKPNLRTIFAEALEKETPEARAEYLEAACGGNAEFRGRVEALLSAHGEAGNFLGGPESTSRASGGTTAASEALSAYGFDHGRFLPGVTLATRYRIVGLLGRGGMGEVYRADDLKLGQSVALKFLPEKLALDQVSLRLFHNEVRLAREVSHQNVCRVYDIGEIDGHHFISMEYIDGEDLASLLKRIHRFSRERAVEIARELCLGLSAAHEKGVLHRDLKPGNVMIDGRGKAKITDFGLAALPQELSAEDIRAGTPAYMAPEQLEGKEVTERSDIYSLGLILYEVFTGEPAFEADTVKQMVEDRRSSTRRTPSSVVDGIDPAVEKVILRCLELEPAERPSSATAVIAALPGEDPLQAAIAAGETPSPEMVAASGGQQRVSPRVAGVLLGAFVLALAGVLALENLVPAAARLRGGRHPEVLADRARMLLDHLGYGDAEGLPPDTAHGFELDRDRSKISGASEQAETAQAYFWYRHSPASLEPLNILHLVDERDPPEQDPGMARVRLDLDGTLLRFSAIPRNLAPPGAPSESVSGKWWSHWFPADLTGIDLDALQPVASVTVTPPVHCDELRSWKPKGPETGGLDFASIEAGLRGGLPVYFRVVRDGDALSVATRAQDIPAFLVGFILVLILVLVFFCTRNLLRRRADLVGAAWLGVFFFCVRLCVCLLEAHHPFRWGPELRTFLHLTEHVGFRTLFIVMCYVALEPHVRRLWPGTLVTWTRVLRGQFLDPRVGRDVLFGVAYGTASFAVVPLRGFLAVWQGELPDLSWQLRSPLGTPWAIYVPLSSFSMALWLSLQVLFMLLVARRLARNEWLAAMLYTLGTVWLWDVHGTGLAGYALASLFLLPHVFVVARFGLVALLASGFAHVTLVESVRHSVWYDGPILFAILFLSGVALYGFWRAVAGGQGRSHRAAA